MSVKIKLLGKNLDDIQDILAEFGLEQCGNDTVPELVVTYGGDGALLGAQRQFPDIPKLPLRDAATAPVCAAHPARSVIADFVDGKLALTRLPELTATAPQGELTGINDLVVKSQEDTSALRYRVFIDGELYAQEVVGDGVCFSSVHGSSAYYRSITRGIFRVGIGLAFSNSTETVDHLVLPESSVVTVEILRGPGVVMADNDPCKYHLEVGEKVVLQQSSTRFASVWGLESFMCPECRFMRHRLLSLNEKRC